MPTRPRTGQKRRTRQPLKMDKLPTELRDRVMQERAAGRTWTEIEELSPKFIEWEKTSKTVRAQFAGLKLPHTTLLRWYDLRVEQVKKEVMANQARAKEIAAIFAGKQFNDLPQVVRSALGDLIFGMMIDSPDRHKTIARLLALGGVLVQQSKIEIKERQVQVATRRVELLERDFEMRKRKFDSETDKAARKVGKGQPITVEAINRIRERLYGLPPVQPSTACSAAIN